MRVSRKDRATILIADSLEIPNWVREFRREATKGGITLLAASQLRDNPLGMKRALLDSDLVLVFADPIAVVNTSWATFLVGAALALNRPVWLVTPSPVPLQQPVAQSFDDLRAAVGAHVWGSPKEIVHRIGDWLPNDEALAS
jgi:hypothetical protein